MWGGCQNKLSAFLPLVCKSLFFNALNCKKSAPRCMKANTKPTWSSRIQAPRRKINLYPATPAVRQSPKPLRPTRTRSGSASWLRSHGDPDHPEKYDKADERNEGHA
jgi:hypothetical protein